MDFSDRLKSFLFSLIPLVVTLILALIFSAVFKGNGSYELSDVGLAIFITCLFNTIICALFMFGGFNGFIGGLFFVILTACQLVFILFPALFMFASENLPILGDTNVANMSLYLSFPFVYLFWVFTNRIGFRRLDVGVARSWMGIVAGVIVAILSYAFYVNLDLNVCNIIVLVINCVILVASILIAILTHGFPFFEEAENRYVPTTSSSGWSNKISSKGTQLSNSQVWSDSERAFESYVSNKIGYGFNLDIGYSQWTTISISTSLNGSVFKIRLSGSPSSIVHSEFDASEARKELESAIADIKYTALDAMRTYEGSTKYSSYSVSIDTSDLR